MRREILAVGLLFLSISSCKKAENPVNPSWELSGKIVYSLGDTRNYKFAIYVLDLSSPNPQPRLLVDGGSEPRVSPDGRVIAFTTDSLDIGRIEIDGSGMMKLTDTRGPMESWPDWSPDGSKIVFVRDFSPFETLWIMNADGSGLRQLTDTSYLATGPRWSPDGKSIAFLLRSPNNRHTSDLAFIDPNGIQITSVVQNVWMWPIEWFSTADYLLCMGRSNSFGFCSLLDLKGHTSRRIGPDGLHIDKIHVWPGTEKVIFVGQTPEDSAANRSSVYLSSVRDPSNVQKIASGFSGVNNVAGSPVLSHVAVFGRMGDDKGLSLYVVRIGEGSATKVATLDTSATAMIIDFSELPQWIQ